MSHSNTMLTLYAVCVYSCEELIQAIKRLKIKLLREKTHTECCCISDTAVISLSCDYVCWLLRWDPPTVHLKSFFGELPYYPSASCLIWKSPYGLLSCTHIHKNILLSKNPWWVVENNDEMSMQTSTFNAFWFYLCPLTSWYYSHA